MTLKQMQYALVAAKCGSLSDASKRLYVSQPSVSEAIHNLEEELGFPIFLRERTGIVVTPEGEEFLNAVQSIVDQVGNIEKQYKKDTKQSLQFSVSVIHYFFMAEVFAELVNQLDGQDIRAYSLHFLDGGTLEVVDDVMNGLSEIGIMSFTEHNKIYIMRELKKKGLDCFEITSTRLYAFLRGNHPLARQGKLRLRDLEDYPYASLWQGKSTMYYFTEEGIFLPSNQKKIFVKDCGAMRTLLRDTNAFAMGTGVIPAEVGPEETRAVQVEDAPITTICWIRRAGTEVSPLGKQFLEMCAARLGRTITI